MNGVDFYHHTTNINSFDDVYKELKKKNEKDGIKTEIKYYNENIFVVNRECRLILSVVDA